MNYEKVLYDPGAVKVLIYSSKEMYEKSSYIGRAEAHIIAYRSDDNYRYFLVKNRTGPSMWMIRNCVGSTVSPYILERHIQSLEKSSWENQKCG